MNVYICRRWNEDDEDAERLGALIVAAPDEGAAEQLYMRDEYVAWYDDEAGRERYFRTTTAQVCDNKQSPAIEVMAGVSAEGEPRVLYDDGPC